MSSSSTRRVCQMIALSSLAWICLCAVVCFADATLLSLGFEDNQPGSRPSAYQLLTAAAITAEQKHSGEKSLKITGNGSVEQYGLFTSVKVLPGKYYKVSFYFKTIGDFASTNSAAIVRYVDALGQVLWPQQLMYIQRRNNWRCVVNTTKAPLKADRITIKVQLSSVPASQAVFIDDVAIEEIDDPFAGMTIDFENWSQKPVREFALGPGAEVIYSGGQETAHSGESCLRVTGNNDPVQYFAILDPMLVKPDTAYDFSFFYRTTPQFMSFHAAVVNILFLDSSGAEVADRDWWWITPLPAEHWSKASRKIITPKGTHHLELLLRLVNALPSHKFWMDDLSIKEGTPVVSLRYEIDPDEARLHGKIEVTANAIDILKEYSIVITGEDGKRRELTRKPEQKDFTIDLSNYPDGVKQTIRGIARLNDGRELATEESWDKVFYVFNKRPWENNHLGELGRNDPAPAPWTSVNYDAAAQTMSDWNNKIKLGDDLLMQSLSYKKPQQQVFRKPMELYLDSAALSEVFHFRKPRVVYDAKHKVALETTGRGKVFDVRIRLSVEFDGFSKYEVSLIPKEDSEVKSFTMEMQLPRVFLQHIIRSGSAYNNEVRPVNLRDKTEWGDKEFRSEIWFGNVDTGLSWCADRILPATQIQKKEWVEVKLDRERAAVSIHLVNDPVRVVKGKELTLSFALIPTPSRPVRNGVRDMKVGVPNGGRGEDMVVVFPNPSWNVYYGYPQPTSESGMANVLKSLSDYRNPLVYMGPGWADQSIPQVTYFKSKWLISGPLSHTFDLASFGWPAPYTSAKLGEKSWVDMYCSKAAELFKRYASIKGIYFDCWGGQCYEDKDGFMFPLFETREFHKRLYVILKRAVPEAWVMYHTSYMTGMPMSSFGDMSLGGEHYTAALMEHPYYLAFISLDDLRADLATNLGPVRTLLPNYYQTEKAKDRKLATHTVGLAMIHGALLYPCFANLDVMNAMRERLWSFGKISECVLCPYWKTNPYLKGTNTGVVFSYYEHNGNLFVILFNSTGQAQATTLELTSDYLRKFTGKRTARLYDPATDKQIEIDLSQNKIDVALDPYLCKLLIVTF